MVQVQQEPDVNYWALQFSQLEKACLDLARSKPTVVDSTQRAEMERLYASWEEALALPEETYEETSRRANVLAGLRKRTIEILVKTQYQP
jgi:hypothetical protein